MSTLIKKFFKGSALGTAPTRFYISNKALTTNLATLTTNASHGITQVGTIVAIQGVDSTFDGVYSIHSIPTATTFTYVKTIANVSTVAVSPVGVATFYATCVKGYVVTNKVIQNYVVTLTSAAHGLVVGDVVAVTIGDSTVDTAVAVVIAVPSTTTFCYISTTQTLATAAVSQGAFGKYPAQYTGASTLINAVLTDMEISNDSASTATIFVSVGGVTVLPVQALAAGTLISWQGRVVMNASEVITAVSSDARVSFALSGVENA